MQKTAAFRCIQPAIATRTFKTNDIVAPSVTVQNQTLSVFPAPAVVVASATSLDGTSSACTASPVSFAVTTSTASTFTQSVGVSSGTCTASHISVSAFFPALFLLFAINSTNRTAAEISTAAITAPNTASIQITVVLPSGLASSAPLPSSATTAAPADAATDISVLTSSDTSQQSWVSWKTSAQLLVPHTKPGAQSLSESQSPSPSRHWNSEVQQLPDRLPFSNLQFSPSVQSFDALNE